MKALQWLFGFGAIVILAGCAGPSVEAPPVSETRFTEDYRIGVGDELRINVWRNEELSGTVPVRPDGKISMALVGDVTATGQTTMGLAS